MGGGSPYPPRNLMMTRLDTLMTSTVIYTAIIGGVDSLIDPRVRQRAPMVCFTDNPQFRSRHWDIRPLSSVSVPPDVPGHAAALSRWFKLLPHIHFPTCDYTIWIDGSDQLLSDPTLLIPFDEDWVSFRHPDRQCVYQELKAIVRFKKDTQEAMTQLEKRYRSLNVPPNIGMAACSMLWRRNTEAMRGFNQRWWEEFLAGGARRDQPAWAYCNWRQPVRARLLPGHHMRNQFVHRRSHVRKIPNKF